MTAWHIYGDLLIKPPRKVYEDLIVSDWPNVQRIMASLAQKDVTQATNIRKLSSHTRQNQIKNALWELDNIRRSSRFLTAQHAKLPLVFDRWSAALRSATLAPFTHKGASASCYRSNT